MIDIVERLREGCGCNFPETTCMAESECADAFEAADTITSLRAEVARLNIEVDRLKLQNDTKRKNRDALRARVRELEAALTRIATENIEYTTGEGHSNAIWIARTALKEKS